MTRRQSVVVLSLVHLLCTAPSVGWAQDDSRPSPSVVMEVVDATEAAFELPAFISRLAVEWGEGIGDRAEKRRRLEEKVQEVFAGDALSLRMRMVRDGSLDHTWADWFADLDGIEFSPATVQTHGPESASVLLRRLYVTPIDVAPGTLDEVFQRFPVQDMTREELAGMLREWPKVVLVTWLGDVSLDLVHENGRWKITRMNISPAWAYTSVLPG